jgi:cell division initiation protein
MAINPVELKQRQIPRSFVGGYNREAVDRLLDEIVTSCELILAERTEMAERNEQLTADLSHSVELEGTLRSTLISAERAAQVHRERALQEADLILDEARTKARQLTRDSKDDQERLGVTAREMSVFLRAAISNLETAGELAAPRPPTEKTSEPATTGLELRDPSELSAVKKLVG